MTYNIPITLSKWDINFDFGRESYSEYVHVYEYSPGLITIFKIIDFRMCSEYSRNKIFLKPVCQGCTNMFFRKHL